MMANIFYVFKIKIAKVIKLQSINQPKVIIQL